MKTLDVDVRIERKHDDQPPFVVIPSSRLKSWRLRGTTTVEGSLDGVPLGRRSLRRWDDERWFIELGRGLLEAAGKGPGDRVSLAISPASTALPAELRDLIGAVPEARACWEARTEAQQRMLREHVLAAKAPATRERRARRALLPEPEPEPPPVAGLRAQPRALRVRILGRRLPGRSCGPYDEVAVGLVGKTGCPPEDSVPADAQEVAWETRIEVRDDGGRPAFRGPAVNGPPRERFLYLTWTARKNGAEPAMFRRAKLRLDAVPAAVLARALRSGVLVARLDLTAEDGTPVCGSVRPPAIRWSS